LDQSAASAAAAISAVLEAWQDFEDKSIEGNA